MSSLINPDGGLIQRGGLLNQPDLLVPGKTGAIPTFPIKASDVAAIMPNAGYPSHIFMFDEASGGLQCEVTGAIMAANGTPTYGVTPQDFADERAVGFTHVGGDYFDNTSIMQAGGDSIAMLFVVELVTASAIRKIMEAGGAEFYQLELNADGSIDWHADDGTTLQTATVAGNHKSAATARVILAVMDRNASAFALHTHLGSHSVALTIGNVDNTRFWFGSDGANTAGVNIIYAALWKGSGAEGLVEADRAAFQDHIGL